ncbi:hypothetical protein C8263_04045 [Deinococcus arcticus]|uniref:Uncharacterized protein n=1 Tax=Deinococcus arcticus TaxID=2136176 RepID=A0A2T3WAN4_9DEIO|nr:hypothetical protein C8263_04045 [Deinococcus arcticus]
MRRVLAVLLGLCALGLLLFALYALAWTVYGPSFGTDPAHTGVVALGAAVGAGLSTWGAVKLWRGKRKT